MIEDKHELFLTSIFQVMDDFGVSSDQFIDLWNDIYHRMKDIEEMRDE